MLRFSNSIQSLVSALICWNRAHCALMSRGPACADIVSGVFSAGHARARCAQRAMADGQAELANQTARTEGGKSFA
jgi:hypothetical protein